MMQKPNAKTLYDRTMRLEMPSEYANAIMRAQRGRQRQEQAQRVARMLRARKAGRITTEGHYGSTKRDERMARRVAKSYRERQRSAKGTGLARAPQTNSRVLVTRA